MQYPQGSGSSHSLIQSLFARSICLHQFCGNHVYVEQGGRLVRHSAVCWEAGGDLRSTLLLCTRVLAEEIWLGRDPKPHWWNTNEKIVVFVGSVKS